MNREIDMARVICAFAELPDSGSRAFSLGGGEWPLRGFVVRRGGQVFGYVNHCPHAGHPLNWKPDQFLSPDRGVILCASHGAMYDVGSGECIAGPCAGRGLKPLPLRLEAGLVLLSEEVALESA
jgi:nitrite reductase/ring-hydroxylating ferredoxin subunit